MKNNTGTSRGELRVPKDNYSHEKHIYSLIFSIL